MNKKLRTLSKSKKAIYFIVLSGIWLTIASQFNIDIQTNWILSTIVIAIIANLFYPMNKKN